MAGTGAERPLHASLVVRTYKLHGMSRNGNEKSATSYKLAALAIGLRLTPLQNKRVSGRRLSPVQLLNNTITKHTKRVSHDNEIVFGPGGREPPAPT